LTSGALSIDRTTAAINVLASLGSVAPSYQQYVGNLFTSFAGNATDLFYSMEIPSGPLAIVPTLYDINPQTFAVATMPLIGVSNVIGSGFINGKLYGFTGDV